MHVWYTCIYTYTPRLILPSTTLHDAGRVCWTRQVARSAGSSSTDPFRGTFSETYQPEGTRREIKRNQRGDSNINNKIFLMRARLHLSVQKILQLSPTGENTRPARRKRRFETCIRFTFEHRVMCERGVGGATQRARTCMCEYMVG